jgi:carbon storage regulator CsrA
MLVLTRRDGESIVFQIPVSRNKDLEIEVMLFGVSQGQMKVGITAPREVTIVRKELLPKK